MLVFMILFVLIRIIMIVIVVFIIDIIIPVITFLDIHIVMGVIQPGQHQRMYIFQLLIILDDANGDLVQLIR